MKKNNFIEPRKLQIIFLFILLILTKSNLLISNEKTPKEYIFAYEIYDIRFCFLTPDPFLCKKCLKKDMQIGRKIIFNNKEEIYRENLCIPYKKKFLY